LSKANVSNALWLNIKPARKDFDPGSDRFSQQLAIQKIGLIPWGKLFAVASIDEINHQQASFWQKTYCVLPMAGLHD
jgi:hypothetical protein